jgi:hypothetical protein
MCTWDAADEAAKWANAHLKAPGNHHALRKDDVTDDRAFRAWANLCLTFAASAYLNANGIWPEPSVKGADSTATQMYKRYKRKGLVHTRYETKAGTVKDPPRGALVFYPSPGFHFTEEGHIGVSVGGGLVISARGPVYKPAYVRRQRYDDTERLPGYKGWAFPANAY